MHSFSNHLLTTRLAPGTVVGIMRPRKKEGGREGGRRREGETETEGGREEGRKRD